MSPIWSQCYIAKCTNDSVFLKEEEISEWHGLLLLMHSYIYLLWKRWKLMYTESLSTQTPLWCILQITSLLNGRSGSSSAPHIDSGLRTQSDPRLQKPKSQVLGLTIQVSGSNKVTSPFITCFIHFQVSCFSSAYTTFSHFPVMTPKTRIYIP